MANYCYSEFAIQPRDPKNEKHWKELKEFISCLVSFRDKHTAEVILELYEVWTEAFNLPDNKNIDRRDSLNFALGDVDKLYQKAKKDGYFGVDVDSAWSPPCEYFEKLLFKIFPSLKFDVYAEEPNEDIFINTNPLIWKAKYRVMDYDEETEDYMNTDEQLVELANARLRLAKMPLVDSASAAISMLEEYFEMNINTFDSSWE